MPRLLVLLAVALISTLAVAQDEPLAALPPLEEEAALRSAEEVGALLYRHDRAAARATDSLAKVRGFKRRKDLIGWITEARGDEVVVTFLGRDKVGSLMAYYRVRVDGSGAVVGKPSVLKVPEPLTEFEAAAAQARSTALASTFQSCAKTYNTVVMPEESDPDAWVVYLLPGTTKRNIVPIGGSYRFDVNNRTGVANVQPYTKTCIQLENDPKSAGLMVTHLLDPVPTDIHVFWSIWAQKPLYVATPPYGTVWSINDGKIGLVKRRDAG